MDLESLFVSFVLMCLRSAKHQRQGPDFLAYSLSAHKVVKKLSIPGIVSFLANPNVIVIVRRLLSSRIHPLKFLYLRARQAQLHFVSFHLALSRPYLLFLLAFPSLHRLILSQHTPTPIPSYHHRTILIQVAPLLVHNPYLPSPIASLLMHVRFATL